MNSKFLLYQLKPFISVFMIAIICMGMVALFTAMLPVIVEPLINEFSHQTGSSLTEEAKKIRTMIMDFFNLQPEDLAPLLPFLLLFIFLGNAIFSFFSLFMMKTLGLKVVKRIRDKLYHNIINQSIGFLSKSKTGDLVSRISNDIEQIKRAISETVASYIRESLTLLFLLTWIFVRDWKLALIALVILPLAVIPLVFFGRKVKKRGFQAQETIGELANFLSETISGNKIVKAYNMQGYEIKRFSKLNEKHYKINSKIAVIYSLTQPVMHTIGGIVAFVIFLVATKEISAGTLSPGKFTSFLMAILMMYNPLKRLSQANNEFQQGRASYERVMQIMEQKNPIQNLPDAKDVQIKGSITFKDIFFSYQEGYPILKKINFSIKPNRLIAVVGASGAGKTTLMNLLLRFYEPSSGKILIDNKDIKKISLESLRDSIGLVTQEVFLFNDTIEKNIAYGNKKYSPEEINKAAKVARADLFINELSNGYQTIVGERGAFLSAGQRQRISIARAILKKPSILIFDEATSSLDAESEQYIKEAMAELIKGRTCLVIAHRLSTIIEADSILVMKGGEIKETGTHSELINKKGFYHSLYNLQFPEMDIIM